jgi:hypothetical protein
MARTDRAPRSSPSKRDTLPQILLTRKEFWKWPYMLSHLQKISGFARRKHFPGGEFLCRGRLPFAPCHLA